MNPFFYSEEAGAKGLPPLSPAPQIPAQPKPSLRSGRFQLTMPNTSCTIITLASLRSDCCSPSFRNAVRLPSGIDVHLHRNAQEQLGHASTAFTLDTYAHVLPHMQDEAAARVEAVLTGSVMGN
jgi:integrase